MSIGIGIGTTYITYIGTYILLQLTNGKNESVFEYDIVKLPQLKGGSEACVAKIVCFYVLLFSLCNTDDTDGIYLLNSSLRNISCWEAAEWPTISNKCASSSQYHHPHFWNEQVTN